MTLTWNAQQSAALDACAAWLKDDTGPQVFRLFGYAGTGKTTLARHLAEAVRFPIFAAFTGKAASVMRDKGCPNATTLHSLLYNVKDRDKTKLRAMEAQLAALDPRDDYYPELQAETNLERDRVRRPWFHVNPDSDLKSAHLLVVDEVSMVDKRIGEDILSFGKKVLVLGDPAQLPPVGGGGYFTNCEPDILLTDIHRQAAENPILLWATLARKGETIPYGDLGLARKVRRDVIDDAWLAKDAGQLLCGKNETRRSLNERIRAQLGRTNPFPQRGDTLVMLMNDHKLGVLNGTVCQAYCDAMVTADQSSVWLNIKYPDGTRAKLLQDLRCDAAPFLGKEFAPRDQRLLQIDFGYALTVHKAQGSQWKTVTVYDDGFGKREPEVRRRWLYTAITRAEEQLHIITS
jgi:exodeoxyribonuclease-5